MLRLNLWFNLYIKAFRSDDPDYQRNIDLKEEHTRRVCDEILDISEHLKLDESDRMIAEVIALFHDVGRFEQYMLYKTFADAKSENHALLGIKVLCEHGILDGIEPELRFLIVRSIYHHNRLSIPESESGRSIFFSRLLRDADKLDIWRVVTEYYHQSDGLKNGGIELDLPDLPGISDEVTSALMEEKIVNMKALKTLNDFKLLQMGWIYDIHFTRTFQLIRERNCLEKIRAVLPNSEEIDRIYTKVKNYLDTKCMDSEKVR